MTKPIIPSCRMADAFHQASAVRASCSAQTRRGREKGSVLFYIFLAVGLLAALTFSFVNSSTENTTTQNAYRAAEELYGQSTLIRAAILECTIQYPGGGGDIDGDTDIDADDNPNSPYPVEPTMVDNPHGVAGDDTVANLTCTGAPTGEEVMFGANTLGKSRFLPPPVSGFGDWVYHNDATGVYITVTASGSSAATLNALSRIESKFAACEADVSGTTLTIWIYRVTCP